MSSKSKKPMTRAGYERLASEYNHLKDVERVKVVQGVATAAAEGDRSENAEYIYGRKRMREIDKRLRYLTGVLKDVLIVDPENLQGDKVCFAATAVVRDDDGDEKKLTLVGVGEADADRGLISWQSPVGKALFGKRIGDYVEVEVPSGDLGFEVVDIEFAGSSIKRSSK